jgi:hypothetical protein
LSCGKGAPPVCTAAPASVTPTPGGAPFQVTVESNQCAVYNFNIMAQGTDPAHTTHVFPVTFNATSLSSADYTLEINNSPLTSTVNQPAEFSGALLGTLCYNSPVNLSCGSGAPSTCKPFPASVIPTVGGAQFTVEVSSSAAQTYNFDVVGVGTDPKAIEHTQLVKFISSGSSGFNFSIINNSGSETVSAGQKATYNLEVAAERGTFPGAVTLSFSSCPPVSICALSATQLPSGKSSGAVVFTVTTSAAVVSSVRPQRNLHFYALWLSLPGLLTIFGGLRFQRFGSRKFGRRFGRQGLMFLLLIALLVSLLCLTNACGGGLQGGSAAAAEPGTPSGTYNMSVTATVDDTPPKTATITLTVN